MMNIQDHFDVESLIADILTKDEDVQRTIVHKLINAWSKCDVKNAEMLLNIIPEVTTNLIDQMSQTIQEYSIASNMLILQKAIRRRSDASSLFASMVPVCKTLFPDGVAENCSIAQQQYFEEFVKLLQNPKVFNWDEDKAWADSYNYTEYLKKVTKNLDSFDDEGEQ